MEENMGKKLSDKYRYERKFSFKASNLNSLYSFLIAKGFYEQYPLRIVSSIYYDTNNYHLFRISEAGYNKRIKKRIRWYGGDQKINLEYKIKDGELGSKLIKNDLSEFGVKKKLLVCSPLSSENYEQYIPEVIDQLYVPSAAITYKRFYLISNCQNVRVTLDHKINYSKPIFFNNAFHINNWLSSSNYVMEVKFDENLSRPFDYLFNILDKYRLNLSRYSKYCEAINMLT